MNRPLFMVERNDGLTDNIYDCNFAKGIFTGGAKTYGYEDIRCFFISTEMLIGAVGYTKKSETVKQKTDQIVEL